MLFFLFYLLSFREESRKGYLIVAFWKTIFFYIYALLQSSHFFCYKLTPAPHQRREKLCGPHRKKFGDPCFNTYCQTQNNNLSANIYQYFLFLLDKCFSKMLHILVYLPLIATVNIEALGLFWSRCEFVRLWVLIKQTRCQSKRLLFFFPKLESIRESIKNRIVKQYR